MYVGPDQALPFASFLGVITGLIVTFWSKFVLWFKRLRTSSETPINPTQETTKAPEVSGVSGD